MRTETGGRNWQLAQRLTAALADPARRERTAAAVLLGYLVLWTLYAVISKIGQDLHYDMAEQFALSHELSAGHEKHPPLAAAVVRVWFTLFPAADWAYHLLAVATATVALWIVWRLSARFLDGDKRAVGLALLTLVPFFNFHALKYNQNTVLMPLWAATTLFFLRSFETRSVAAAALAGAAAAGSMYGKYWSVVLLAGLALAALLDRRRASYLRSAAPWVTIAVGGLVLMPNFAWLYAHDFAPFAYASGIHGGRSFAATLRGVLEYIAGAAGYVALPVIVSLLATRPDRAAFADMVWPQDPERRLAASAFWATLLVPIAIALATGSELTSLWTMSAWSLLPVMLLSSPMLAIGRPAAARVVGLAILLPLLALLAAPVAAWFKHRAGLPPAVAHSSLLAPSVERLWRQTTEQPLRLVSGHGDLGYGIAFYLPSRPVVVHALAGAAAPDIEQPIARDGIALICPAESVDCVGRAKAQAARARAGSGTEVEVSRRFLGAGGAPARYLIVIVPPQDL